jgi:hypothetical protein
VPALSDPNKIKEQGGEPRNDELREKRAQVAGDKSAQNDRRFAQQNHDRNNDDRLTSSPTRFRVT